MKYWLYMREDSRIGRSTLDLRNIQFMRSSYYGGEPLKYLMVPGLVKGEIRELSEDRVKAIKDEVATLNIHPHKVRAGAFDISTAPGDPLGKYLTLLPLNVAHERGYLHTASPDPFETMCVQ